MSLPAMSSLRVKWGREKPSYTGQMWVTPSPESTTTPVNRPEYQSNTATFTQITTTQEDHLWSGIRSLSTKFKLILFCDVKIISYFSLPFNVEGTPCLCSVLLSTLGDNDLLHSVPLFRWRFKTSFGPFCWLLAVRVCMSFLSCLGETKKILQIQLIFIQGYYKNDGRCIITTSTLHLI